MPEIELFKTEKLVNAKVCGKPFRIVREQYLRKDISCHSPLCSSCQDNDHERVGKLGKDVTHYLIPLFDVVKNYVEILESPEITGVIYLQTIAAQVLHEVGKNHYGKLLNLVRDKTRGCTLFLNELCKETHVDREKAQTVEEWLQLTARKAAAWYLVHLHGQVPIVVVTENERFIESYQNEIENVLVVHFKDYLQNFWASLTLALELYDSIVSSHTDDNSLDSVKLYSNHVSMDTMTIGIKNGRYIKGKLSVNKYHAQREASVLSCAVKDEVILIPGMKNRNRGIHGDEVCIELLPEVDWQSRIQVIGSQDEDDSETAGRLEKKLPTGRVVGIIQRRWRDYVATLPDEEDYSKNVKKILAIPYDYRIPKIRIVTKQASGLCNQRMVVRIDTWEANSQYPNGHFVKSLGEIGELQTEVATLLLEHEISPVPFSAALRSELPADSPDSPWKMDGEEVSKRKDLRNTHLVFSVDPKGCEDVDDTLSIRQLDNGQLELGVHIADVTHFVTPHSLTDCEARTRGTTVYLADRRFDMLPSVLSSGVCSLLSNVDRFAVSVLWELDSRFEVVDVWYGRTVIRSAYKLFYEVAQEIIDGKESSNLPELTGLPDDEIKISYDTLKEALLKLTDVSRRLKSRRLQGGGVQLDSLEVQFELDQDEAVPKLREHLEIHETVAECMIFANHWVAKKIFSVFPHRSLLRSHPSPQLSALKDLEHLARMKSYQISFDSPKDLAKSLDQAVDATDPNVNTIFRVLAVRAMSEAVYFSTGCFDESDFSHFGLGLDRYTHFTSPIRRYADIVVHRLLLSAVGEIPSNVLSFTADELQELASHINKKHRAAQTAQKSSVELFKAFYFQKLPVDDSQCRVEGIIYSLRKNGVLVIVPQYGLKGALTLYTKEKKVPVVTSDGVTWSEGKLVRTETELRVEVGNCSQTYRTFDHVLVQIKIQMSKSHGPTLHFELLGFVFTGVDGLAGVQQKVDLVQEMKQTIADGVEVDNPDEMQNRKKNSNNNLYNLIRSLRQLSLRL